MNKNSWRKASERRFWSACGVWLRNPRYLIPGAIFAFLIYVAAARGRWFYFACYLALGVIILAPGPTLSACAMVIRAVRRLLARGKPKGAERLEDIPTSDQVPND